MKLKKKNATDILRKLTKNRKHTMTVKAIKIKEIVKNMSGLFGAN